MPIFTGDQLTKIISDTLPKDAQPGEKVVVATVDKDGAKVIASFKLQTAQGWKPSWELQAAAEHDWSGDDKVGAKVVMRWK